MTPQLVRQIDRKAFEVFKDPGVDAPRNVSSEELDYFRALAASNQYWQSTEEFDEAGVVIECEGRYYLCGWLETRENLSNFDLPPGQDLASLFPTEPLIRTELRRWEHPFEARLPTLTCNFLRNWSRARQASDHDQESARSFFLTLVQEFAVKGRFPLTAISELEGIRQVCERDLRWSVPELENILGRIRQTLVVVAIEVLRMLGHTRTVDWSFDRLWRGILSGTPKENLLESNVYPLTGALINKLVPRVLGITARKAIYRQLYFRDDILRIANDLYLKHNVAETIVAMAVRQIKIPAWTRVRELLNLPKHGRRPAKAEVYASAIREVLPERDELPSEFEIRNRVNQKIAPTFWEKVHSCVAVSGRPNDPDSIRRYVIAELSTRARGAAHTLIEVRDWAWKRERGRTELK